jgi:hypothetical protein
LAEIWEFFSKHYEALGVAFAALGVLVALGAWLWPPFRGANVGSSVARGPAIHNDQVTQESVEDASEAEDSGAMESKAANARTIADFSQLRTMPTGTYMLRHDPALWETKERGIMHASSIVIKWIFFSMSITILPFGLKAVVLNAAGHEANLINLVGSGELFLMAAAMGAAALPPLMESKAHVALRLTLAGLSVVALALGAVSFALVASIILLADVQDMGELVKQSGLLDSAKSARTAEMSIFLAVSASIVYLSALITGDR